MSVLQTSSDALFSLMVQQIWKLRFLCVYERGIHTQTQSNVQIICDVPNSTPTFLTVFFVFFLLHSHSLRILLYLKNSYVSLWFHWSQLSCWLWQTTWLSWKDERSKNVISYISNPYQEFTPNVMFSQKNKNLSSLLTGKCFGCQHYLDFLWSFLQTLLLGWFPWLSMVPISEWSLCLSTENWIRACLQRGRKKTKKQ